jgi:ribonuclease R
MLAANEAVARWFASQGLPTVNRFHGQPDEDKLAIFSSLAGVYGLKVPAELDSLALNGLLEQLKGHPEARALNQLLLRSMMQAIYSSKQRGHYGLGATDYLHFTSPIRRYPDLLVHRLLHQFWERNGARRSHGELEAEQARLEELAARASERERAAMQVEREVVSFYSCLLIEPKVGQELDGTVSALMDHGFFVELDGLFVEGMVTADSVGSGYELDPRTYRLGWDDGQVVKVGEKVKVRVESVNLQRRQITFELMSELPRGPRVRAPDQRGRSGSKHRDHRPGGKPRAFGKAGKFGKPGQQRQQGKFAKGGGKKHHGPRGRR